MNLNHSRRQFVASTLLGAAALSFNIPNLLAAGKKIPVGLELYSVRNECAKDLPKTIEGVAKIGYKGVEFAGFHGCKAKDLRKLLDDNGLVCCGSHTPYDDLKPDRLAATLEFNQVLGNKFVICPWLEGKTKQDWLDLAKFFNEQSDKVRAQGMYLGYHAHSHDFNKIDGVSSWDLFFGNTKDEVVMQLDTSNCMEGGADPVAVLKKYAKRARTIHVKEFGGPANAVIGEGTVNFQAVFDVCEKSGVTQWYVVESEHEGDAVGDVTRCYAGMKKLGKV